MGKEGAARCAGHQGSHLPLLDGPIEFAVPRQGPVPELLLLPLVPGVVAEAAREHGGLVEWLGAIFCKYCSLPHRGVGVIRFIGLINLKLSNVQVEHT